MDEMLRAFYDHFKDDLTYWESQFIASIQTQWTRSQYLTPSQERVLNEIWDGFASGRRRRVLGAESE